MAETRNPAWLRGNDEARGRLARAKSIKRWPLRSPWLSERAVLNLERALKVGDRLGGHWVTGHVDTVGTLARRARRGGSWRLEFRFPPRWSPYVVEKGSIAVNGVSLTVNGCGEGELDVNIVPHTSRMTTLESMQTGEKVNLEMDLMGKYVEKMLRGWRKKDSEQPAEEASIDVGFLQKHGFLD